MRRKLAAGNWKMNGSIPGLDMIGALKLKHPECPCDVLLCPPAPLLTHALQNTAGSPIFIGAQNCHAEEKGAYTGDHSAAMIAEIGATHVIVGHSERRDAYGETDAQVAAKAQAAQAAGLTAIVCIGESLAQREAGDALDVIRTQLQGSVPDDSAADTLVIAYEPIWAIGTGKIPTMAQIAEVHALMRQELRSRFGDSAEDIRLLYGGSVKPDNAAEIFALDNVDGALVGGASLRAEDFSPIIQALADS
ncbi:triose-phosphate isomerase [Roseobacter sinensis]|uniref:Triosephosphate isomerase n=1 Tax=Roseobacter sinensis TaxID=2931391 RepID=A0ABT3BBW4_9RHOB|nr:triose-phosphate isomerase [Roseobacter sp. WL0113]MCV3271076.1 triose-phosphate isomerase [Roseobacter sp. WL0113]